MYWYLICLAHIETKREEYGFSFYINEFVFFSAET